MISANNFVAFLTGMGIADEQHFLHRASSPKFEFYFISLSAESKPKINRQQKKYPHIMISGETADGGRSLKFFCGCDTISLR